MKKILVTGGAGFIGSHLCDLLLENGYYVTCLDNLITGKAENIEHLKSNGNFRFINHDISQPLQLNNGTDYIVHAASPASPVDYLKFPIETLKAGTHGTYNTLKLAKEKGAKHLLTSTSEIYGDPEVHPQPESYWGNVNSIGLRSCYDEAKRSAEAIVMAYHRIHGIETHICRIFNTYGPRMKADDGRAIPNFISQALKNENLTVYGDGYQTRSFCYVSDLVEGIYKLLLSDYNYPVNLGNPIEMNMIELANIIIEATGSNSKIIYKDLPADDPKQRRPDILKAKNILGWNPRISFEEGITKTIEYFRGGLPADS